MRNTLYNGGGYGLNGLSPAGGPISAPLYLPSNPTDPMHAVTKEYVDQVLGHVPVGNIVGTIPAERLPAFTGQDIASSGYGIFELKPTGVVPGTYNKVTVNAKGLVTFGELIDYSVLTNIPWSSITEDKPTTLEGYGITDALRVTGGTMTGPLYITNAPTAANHLVNKAYVDSAIAAREAQGAGKVGDIVMTASTTAPANHLRCNGAIVSQTTYAALYAVIQGRYNVGTVAAGNFQLPDTTTTDLTGMISYIKYA